MGDIARFVNSPELFGFGVGSSTSGDIMCQLCGTRYNEGADERGLYDNEPILHTEFAGIDVCECCFHRIENEVLKRMPDILLWYRGIIDARRRKFLKNDAILKELGC